ncbi:MAG: hypothetical protein COU69_04580 [Candidatus Pacebacteria bacterium CG10_big_fil_rev_8_21_14_0_10_56_10]|nr:MAG: hypothetical protein COU69_04580 [Candidatus Pacebacteria bacterium CG10_big_fil_rev_8_21_14_0_10_56_10]
MARQLPLLSVVIVTYNSAEHITACLRSLWRASYPRLEVLVVDNNSTDQTAAAVAAFQRSVSGGADSGRPASAVSVRTATTLSWLPQRHNRGFAGGCNHGIARARAQQVLVLNPDTVVAPDFAQPLVRAMLADDQLAACQPSVYLLDERRRLNLTGKETQYLGLDWIRDYRAPAGRAKRAGKKLVSVSGSGVLLRKTMFDRVGGFDDAYFMYYEDTDLSWRLRLAGYRLRFVPASRLYHAYRYRPTADSASLTFNDKLYWAERNRWLTILKNYRARTLLLVLPMLLVWETALLGYALSTGWLGRKLAAYQAVWALRRHLVGQRRQVAGWRVVPDRQIVSQMATRITFSEFQHPVVKRLINPLAAAYYQVLIKLV